MPSLHKMIGAPGHANYFTKAIKLPSRIALQQDAPALGLLSLILMG
jgi:hypothetical protein